MLRCVLEITADYLPHRETTLLFSDIIVFKSFPSSFKWKDTLPNVNSLNKTLELQAISVIGLRRFSIPKYKKKRAGDNLVRCGE
jgi:hypothetical protein